VSVPSGEPAGAWRSALQQPAFLLLALVVVALFFGRMQVGRTSVGIDYYQYWAIVEATRSLDVGNVYSDEESARIGGELLRRATETEGAGRFQGAAEFRQVLTVNQSPFLYVALSPLISGDYEVDFRSYNLLSLLLGAVSVLGLAALAGLAPIESAAVLLLVLAVYEPLFSDLRVGNVGLLQLAALVLYVWNQSRRASTPRDLLGGAVLGIAVMFKPTLAVVVAVLGISWLVVGDWRKCRDQAIGALAAVALSGALTGLFFGRSRIWLEFLELLPFPDAITPLSEGNWSPAAVLTDLTGLHLATVLLVGLLGLTGWLLWRRRERLRATAAPDLLAVALGCLVLLLGSPLAWVHYYLLTIPALVLAVAAVGALGRPAITVFALGACLLPLLDSPLLQMGWRAFPHLYVAWVAAGVAGLYAFVLRGLDAGAYDAEP